MAGGNDDEDGKPWLSSRQWWAPPLTYFAIVCMLFFSIFHFTWRHRRRGGWKQYTGSRAVRCAAMPSAWQVGPDALLVFRASVFIVTAWTLLQSSIYEGPTCLRVSICQSHTLLHSYCHVAILLAHACSHGPPFAALLHVHAHSSSPCGTSSFWSPSLPWERRCPFPAAATSRCSARPPPLLIALPQRHTTCCWRFCSRCRR